MRTSGGARLLLVAGIMIVSTQLNAASASAEGVAGGDGLRMTPRQHRSLQAAVTGPGRGPNAAARNAIYATCPKPCNLTACCTPVEDALNAVVKGCSTSTTLDCTCLLINSQKDKRVTAVTKSCGCPCLTCCFNALSAGANTGCPSFPASLACRQ